MPHFHDVTQPSPSCFSGSSSRNERKSASSNFLVGANCQSRGPRRSPSSVTPEFRNRLTEFAPSDSTRRLVQKRDPLTENMNPSGVSRAHLRKLSGFCEP